MLDVFAGGTPLDETASAAGCSRRSKARLPSFRPGLLAPMSTRAVLLRLQNNIKLRRLAAGDVPEAALACTEDMLRIAPDAAGLWRTPGC